MKIWQGSSCVFTDVTCDLVTVIIIWYPIRQTVLYIAAEYWSQRDTVPDMFSKGYFLYKHCTNCTLYNRTLLRIGTQKPLLHVWLHNSTAHLLYKYCTNCTFCNWTVLTVIKHKLLLHVQLHNSTANLLYKLYSLQLTSTYSN